MVSILKKPTGNSKGILIAKHTEREFLKKNYPAVRERLRAAREEYLVGMHWGGGAKTGIGPTPLVDFNLACPGIFEFTDEVEAYRIPLCSRSFLPSYFRPMDVEERWDILYVTRPSSMKRNSDLLRVVRRAYDEGHDWRVLIICPIPEELDGPKAEPQFFEDYREMFTDEERTRIELMTPTFRGSWFPVPRDAMPFFYSASRVFTHFGTSEGQPKVTTEALLCGTPVLVRADQRGGGHDHLTENNGLVFHDLEDAFRKLEMMLENPSEFEVDIKSLREKTTAEYNLPRLRKHLRRIYEAEGIPFQGELLVDDLSLQLPSHLPTLPSDLRDNPSNTLMSPESMVQFLDWLLDRDPAPSDLWTTKLRRPVHWAGDEWKKWMDRLQRAPAWIVDQWKSV